MGEHTQCNHCSLEQMQEEAAERGAHVIMESSDAWIAVRYSDEDVAHSFFLQLTSVCVC